MPTEAALARTVLMFSVLALAGCGGGLGGGDLASSASAPPPPMVAGPPPVSMAGRWQLSSPGRGQCYMNFGAASAAAAEGTVAPEGGCPGRFFTSRKWTYEQGNLVMRDHTGAPLAQLSDAGGRFDGKATAGDPVTLAR
jgi:hypothetical protein